MPGEGAIKNPIDAEPLHLSYIFQRFIFTNIGEDENADCTQRDGVLEKYQVNNWFNDYFHAIFFTRMHHLMALELSENRQKYQEVCFNKDYISLNMIKQKGLHIIEFNISQFVLFSLQNCQRQFSPQIAQISNNIFFLV